MAPNLTFSSPAGGSNVVQRILDILKFLWVLLLAMLDGLIDWLGTLTKQYVDMSTVLWVERNSLTQKLSRVRSYYLDFSI